VNDILIKCPQNLRPVRTGLTTDMIIFETLPPVAIPLRCPACGYVHRWKPEDAWVAQVPRLVHTGWRCPPETFPLISNARNVARATRWWPQILSHSATPRSS